MAKAENSSGDEEKVRLQIVLCKSVAEDLARHARELSRSQSWVAGWAIKSTLDDKGTFVHWIAGRIKKAAKCQAWAIAASENEARLQLRIERSSVEDLETVAMALNQSPLKLAGLMIEHGLDSFAQSLALMKTPPGKLIRRLFKGPETYKNYDDVENDPKDLGDTESKEG